MTQALFRHILVPTDGSQPSMAAGQLAVQLAVANKAHVTFVYVVDDTVAHEIATAAHRPMEQIQGDLKTSGQHYLDHLTRVATEAKVESTQKVCHGVPPDEIAELARHAGADLIVMGQVGSRGSRHILMGSVTERVIEHAPCPVMVVK
jgi:nucleotide-binding universal stress UspA family protein